MATLLDTTDIALSEPKVHGKKRQRFVSFIDVLGFSDHVRHSREHPNIVLKIERTVVEALRWVRGCKPHPTGLYTWRLRTFSDCMMFSQPETSLGLLNMFEAVAYLVRRMIIADFPVRGAISFDHHIQFKLTIPSPALVAAYRLEQTIRYPRVALANEVTARVISTEIDDLLPELSQFVAFDEVGHAFLNYLVCDEDDEENWNLEFLVHQKRFLEARLLLTSLDDGVNAKYRWMAAFHDWCVRSAPMVTEEDHWLLPKELLILGGDLDHYFISLAHILILVSLASETQRPFDWMSLRQPQRWPFNVHTEFDPSFAYLCDLIQPLTETSRWCQRFEDC